jgi:hypothetical protein
MVNKWRQFPLEPLPDVFQALIIIRFKAQGQVG